MPSNPLRPSGRRVDFHRTLGLAVLAGLAVAVPRAHADTAPLVPSYASSFAEYVAYRVESEPVDWREANDRTAIDAGHGRHADDGQSAPADAASMFAKDRPEARDAATNVSTAQPRSPQPHEGHPR